MSGMADFAPWLGVFETLRVLEGVPLFVEEHHAELRRAATALGLNARLDLSRTSDELAGRSGRWRWIVTPEETRTLFNEEAMPSGEPVGLGISSVRIGSQELGCAFQDVQLSRACAGARDGFSRGDGAAE